MFLHIKNALTEEQLVRARELTAQGEWVDGTATASGVAAGVKKNLQINADSELARRAGALVIDAIRQHPQFELAVQPHAFVQPLFSRYEPGMSYGYHLDAPMLGRGETIRADISVTVFLNERHEYDGGELIIDVGSESIAVSGDAGDCVIYPSSSFHRVAEVTRGVRLVSAFWAQSLVRDPAKRQILYDIGSTFPYFELMGIRGPYVERIRNSYNNLIRLWAEI